MTWWHDLQGGAIAERRPPPPGADLPYPKLATIPAKPVLPNAAYRAALENQLIAERDRTRQVAARNPVVAIPTPKPPPPQSAPPGQSNTANGNTANATLPTAEAPPVAPATASAPPPPPPLVLVGTDTDTANFPPIPDAPPPPATFEGVPAEPLPTPPPPVRPVPNPAGVKVLFAPGVAEIPPSQAATLKDIVGHRGHQRIEITGYGDEQGDSPEAQEAAVTLGLARAKSLAAALISLHVPEDALRIAAGSTGTGAILRLLPS